MSESKMEVPRCLKHLIQKVMRGFYQIECVIIMDLLLRRHIMKEDDLADVLKFERKQLRALLTILKNDKLIKSKLKIETNSEGKSIKHNYYYINFKGFVNVVKYKLDFIRKKIEQEERNMTSRASFKCTRCDKSFTDLDIKEFIVDIEGYKCWYCQGVVEEDNCLPKPDSRVVLAKFNETMEPLYMLLKEIEDIRLPDELIDPQLEINNQQQAASTSSQDVNSQGKNWRQNDNFAINHYNNIYGQNNFVVKIEDVDSVDSGSSVKEEVIKKEQPIWMKRSTVTDDSMQTNGDSTQSVGVMTKNMRQSSSTKSHTSINSNGNESEHSKEILETLLMHEKQGNGLSSSASATAAISIDHHDNGYIQNDINDYEMTNNEQDNFMSDVEDDTENQIPKIKVGDKLYSIDEIDDHIISLMSPSEKQDYIKLSQQIYSHLYDI